MADYQWVVRHFQRVKEPPNRQNAGHICVSLAPALVRGWLSNREAGENKILQNACYARRFALLRNAKLTVSIYADSFALLVFGAPLTSGSLSKNKFFDRLKNGGLPMGSPPFFKLHILSEPLPGLPAEAW